MRKKNNQESEVSSIAEMTTNFTESVNDQYIANLEMKNEELARRVSQLMKVVEAKDQELEHLKGLLTNSNLPVIGTDEAHPIIPSDEEVICDIQIKKLKTMALDRSLTLDETRQLDLLIKNKRLAQGAATTIESKGKAIPTDTNSLIMIASKRSDKDK